MLSIVITFMVASFTLAAFLLLPILYTGIDSYARKRSTDFAHKMDRMLIRNQIKTAARIYVFGPFILAPVGFFAAPDNMKVVGLIFGMVLGFVLPRIYVSFLIGRRRKKFEDQLIDAMMIMSSSFRGGLSIIQAIEAVVEEMPDPIQQEFGIMLGENKMGVSLDEALTRLFKRMPGPDLQQMVTAVILARETGGNLPVIFSRIISSVRARKRVRAQLETLTVQGKIQGVVMSALPVIFFVFLSQTNKKFYNAMVGTDIGVRLLFISFILWVIGTFFIWKISQFKDF